VDEGLQGLLVLIAVAVGAVCMATGVLGSISETIADAIRSLF
jgi:hypothetical protein